MKQRERRPSFVATQFSRLKPRHTVAWLFQVIASSTWTVSVLLAGLDSASDWWQLLASTAWTVGNVLSFPDVISALDPSAEDQCVEETQVTAPAVEIAERNFAVD
jgi:hypothetical protein